MQSSLPPELIHVFERSVTTDYVTLDAERQPIAWPVTPYYQADEGCIDVTTGLGEPSKADDAAHDPHVALLFSDPSGGRPSRAPMVLVQGTAAVDDRDLDANRERFERDARAKAKAPWARQIPIPDAVERRLSWYFSRIYVHVRPERIYVWPGSDPAAEPSLYDAHLEEVRSGHSEEPELEHAPPRGGGPLWDERLDRLDDSSRTATLCVVAPDGFPFAVRVPVRPDRATGTVRIEAEPVGVPLEPGLASLFVHVERPRLRGRQGFQLCGDLVDDGRGWGVAPHRVLGEPSAASTSALDRGRAELLAALRFRRTAKAEQRRRGHLAD